MQRNGRTKTMAKPKEGDIQFSTLLPLEAYHALCWRKHQLQVRSGATVKLREVLLDELQPLIEDYRKAKHTA